ncbi:MAG: hypothetical protein ACRCSV_05210 [Chlamydiales bacterium]
MNTKEYNYIYANRIGNALTEPFYKLYKVDTKYLETFDTNRDIAKRVFDAVSMLLLNTIAFPLSLPLWFIGKAIIQYTSPKVNYSFAHLECNTGTDANETCIKNLLAMVKDHKESTIIQVFSHGAWYALYDYRIEPNRKFGAIPGLESSRNTDSTGEKVHGFLEQKMILTKLSNLNSLIEAVQKNLNAGTSNEVSPTIETSEMMDAAIKNLEQQALALTHLNKGVIFNIKTLRDQNPDASFEDLIVTQHKVKIREIKDSPEIIKKKTKPVREKFSNSYNYSDYLVKLVSKKHDLPHEESINFVAKNFYTGNDITYQGVNCLLKGVGVLS